MTDAVFLVGDVRERMAELPELVGPPQDDLADIVGWPPPTDLEEEPDA